MKDSFLGSLNKRRILALFLSSIAFTCGIFWVEGQRFSWAAPGQDPNLQTIPTRRPTATLAVTVSPSVPPPHEDSDEGGAETPPRQTSDETMNRTDRADASTPAQPPTLLPEEPVTPDTLAPGEPVTPLETPFTPTTENNSLVTPLSSPVSESTSTGNPQPATPDLIETGGTGTALYSLTLPSPPPTLASILADQPDPSSEVVSLAYPAGSLYWLYALGVGIILILIGIFLVNLSRFRQS